MANTEDRIYRCSRARRLYCILFSAVSSYKLRPFYSLPIAQWLQEPSSYPPVLPFATVPFAKHYLCGRSVFETNYINSKDVGRIKYLVSSHRKIEKKFVCFRPQTGHRKTQVRAECVPQWVSLNKGCLCTEQCEMLVQYIKKCAV